MSGLARPVRVLLVGRYFWPLGSIDSAGHLMELATGLHSTGIHVSVVTPKQSGRWSDRFLFRDFDVYRPIRLFRSGWTVRGDRTATRYIGYLRQWIESNPVSCDLVYCDSGREEAIAAVQAAQALSIPSVVRMAGNGDCSDFDFFRRTRIGRRCRSSVMAADAVIVHHAAAERQWISEGGNPDRAHRIPIGIGPTTEMGLSSRSNLRRSLTRINGDLFVPESCSVVLSVERMRRDSGLMRLVESAYFLSQKITGLQFWLVGDGSHRETIFARLKADGLRQVTSMPGSFGLMEDVFAAADLLIHFGDEGFEHQIPTAISAALPLVLANTATARDFFSISDNDVREQFIDNRRDVQQCPNEPHEAPGKLVWWFDPDRPKTLRLAINQIVDNLEMARNRSGQLRKTLQRVRSRRESIDSFARLFRRLVESNLNASDRNSSVEKTQ